MILEDISGLREQMLAKERADNAYFQEMVELLHTQQEVLEGMQPPAGWDATQPAWMNYVYLGQEVLEVVVPAAKVIKPLSKNLLKWRVQSWR